MAYRLAQISSIHHEVIRGSAAAIRDTIKRKHDYETMGVAVVLVCFCHVQTLHVIPGVLDEH